MDSAFLEKLTVVNGSTKGIVALIVVMLLANMASLATTEHAYSDEHDERNSSLSRSHVIEFDGNETLPNLALL